MLLPALIAALVLCCAYPFAHKRLVHWWTNPQRIVANELRDTRVAILVAQRDKENAEAALSLLIAREKRLAKLAAK